jgi:hypothetical protein
VVVSGNPPDSPWRSTPRDKRRRKPLAITLSAEARKRLSWLANGGSLSRTVEALVMRAEEPPR